MTGICWSPDFFCGPRYNFIGLKYFHVLNFLLSFLILSLCERAFERIFMIDVKVAFLNFFIKMLFEERLFREYLSVYFHINSFIYSFIIEIFFSCFYPMVRSQLRKLETSFGLFISCTHTLAYFDSTTVTL